VGPLEISPAFPARVPHAVQNAAPGGIVALQAEQYSSEAAGFSTADGDTLGASAAASGSREPHPVQKTAPASAKAPHLGHEAWDMMLILEKLSSIVNRANGFS
jgi:hypothetical protein